VVTHQATRHGRPEFHWCNFTTPGQTGNSAQPAPDAKRTLTATSPSLNVKHRLYYEGTIARTFITKLDRPVLLPAALAGAYDDWEWY
jgi:hypothetical protein